MNKLITGSLIAAAAIVVVGGATLMGTSSPATAATKISTGDTVEGITVTDTFGQTHNLSDFAGKNVVLEWTNDACPFVKKHYEADNMQGLQKAARDEGDTVWLTIASSGLAGNAMITGERANALTAERDASPTAFILDAGGATGMAFSAKATPHMYVIDASQKLVYQGAIDDQPTTRSDVAQANNYVVAALEDIRAGRAVQTAETQAYGCPIKYGDDDGHAGPPPGGPRPDGPPPGGKRPEGPPPAH